MTHWHILPLNTIIGPTIQLDKSKIKAIAMDKINRNESLSLIKRYCDDKKTAAAGIITSASGTNNTSATVDHPKKFCECCRWQPVSKLKGDYETVSI